MPENERESMESEAGYGASIVESFASYDPDTLSWRTSQPCLFGGWVEFSETWPQSGTMRNGRCYPLVSLEPTISDADCSSLPTQTAREGRDWSRVEVLASLDRGDGVAKRICALRIGELNPSLIVGLNPCYAEKRMGFPIGFSDLKELETPSALPLPNGSESE